MDGGLGGKSAMQTTETPSACTSANSSDACTCRVHLDADRQIVEQMGSIASASSSAAPLVGIPEHAQRLAGSENGCPSGSAEGAGCRLRIDSAASDNSSRVASSMAVSLRRQTLLQAVALRIVERRQQQGS